MDLDEVDVLLQQGSDQVTQLRAALQASVRLPTPATHDDALPLAPGDLVLDSLTGQLVEVVSGQRTHTLV